MQRHTLSRIGSISRHLPFLLIAAALLLPARREAAAQLLQNIGARELLTDVESKARTDLGNDAIPTNVIFIGIDYMGFSLSMDLNSGKATGWVYRWYSPSRDSSEYLLAVRPLLGGPVIIALSLDTLDRALPFNVGTTALLEPWVDSPAALSGSKTGGAGAFLQAHPDARMSLSVVLRNTTPTPILPVGQFWLLVYTAPGDTMTCLVYSDSGDPLRCTSSNAPVITSSPNTLARVGEPYTYQVRARGVPEPQFSLIASPAGMSIDAVSGLISWTPQSGQTGVHDVSVEASNSNGADRQNYQISVEEAAGPPQITSIPVTETRAGEPYQYNITAGGAPRPTMELETGPTGMMLDPGRWIVTWQPSRMQTGGHTVRIVARNQAGSDTQEFTLTVVSDPRLQPIADRAIKTGELLEVQAEADGFPQPRFSLPVKPEGMTADSVTGLISWTPSPQQTGVHSVAVEARNRVGFHATSFSVTVDAASDARPPDRMNGFGLSAAYPNPSSLSSGSGVSIMLTLPVRAALHVRILDALGRELRLLDASVRDPGEHLLRWDGRLSSGEAASAGVYVIEAAAGGSVVRRLVAVANTAR